MSMHMCRCAFALGLLAAALAQGATVYKWIDAAGVVHYSDQPEPGSEKIQIDTAPIGFVVGKPALAAAQPAVKNTAGLNYRQFDIASPAASQGFYAESVPVRLELSPELRSGHSLSWALNGKALDNQANATQFVLDELPRGTYVLTATITDTSTNETATAPSVTFYMQEPSKLFPHHNNP
jgi:hypothetical protein